MIPKGSVIACDTETTGINFFLGDRPFCFTFCNEKGVTGSYYWKVDPMTRKVQINPIEWSEMKAFFENPDISKVFHNAKFDVFMLEMIGIKVKGRVEDTLLAAYVLRSNEDELGLKPFCKKYLGIADDDEKDLKKATEKARREAKKKGWKIAAKKLHGKKPVAADYWLAPKELVLRYALQDAERTILLWRMLRQLLDADKACRKIYERDLRLHKAVMQMERRGVRISRKIVREKIVYHKEQMRVALDYLQRKHEKDFNPSSPVQIANLVYKKLGFTCTEFTDKGNPKTGSKVLRKFKHPIIDRIITYQSSQKAIATFYKNFLFHSIWNEKQGQYILHPWYNLNGTATGRLSCSNPNLQNVADANTTQALVPEQARAPFKPRKGYVWISIDYSGQELWVYVNNSRDDDMKDELHRGSPHLKTARNVWPDEQAEDEKKGHKTVYKRAKILLFSIIFGSGVKGIHEYHNMPYPEAKRVHRGIHDLYPGIQEFIDEQSKNIREFGYILTPYGRKIWADPDMGYKSANYSVQGTAADVMKKSIISLHEYFTYNFIPASILMTIHDELIIEIPKKDLSSKLVKKIMFIMEDQPELSYIGGKLPVSVSLITNSWAEKKEIKNLEELDNVA